MAGDPAELAYGHALAMLGNPDAAADVAALALRRAGRARSLVLAHARQESVRRASLDPAVDIDSVRIVDLDLAALAATLASTRPPEERAALDLRARTAGDLAALGTSLGMRPADAADKSAQIAEHWERLLDPALLAFGGPGECDRLAETLAPAPQTVGDLLRFAPSVHAHALECTACHDRVRVMASVRTFFTDTSVDVPDDVRMVGRISRTKRPSAPPAPLFGSATRAAGSRRSVVPRSVAAAAAAVLVAGLVGVQLFPRGDAADDATAVMAVATDVVIDGSPAEGFHVRNSSNRSVRYTLSASASWVKLSPARGRLGAGATMPVVATLTADAPEGEARATLVLRTSSEASYAREFTWNVERAPELGTILDGCAVSVTVIDDGDLARLVLHWRDVAEHELDITNDNAGYAAELRPDNGAVTYWVTATDTRGNAARTADQVISPGAC